MVSLVFSSHQKYYIWYESFDIGSNTQMTFSTLPKEYLSSEWASILPADVRLEASLSEQWGNSE